MVVWGWSYHGLRSENTMMTSAEAKTMGIRTGTCGNELGLVLGGHAAAWQEVPGRRLARLSKEKDSCSRKITPSYIKVLFILFRPAR